MLFRAELKKIIHFPVFWCMIVALLLLNGWMIFQCFAFSRQGSETINAYLTGDLTGKEDEYGFCEAYESVRENAWKDYYENFDIKKLLYSGQSLRVQKDSDAVTTLVDRIYDMAENRVREIKEDGEGREEYYPGITLNLHNDLYGIIFPLLLMECAGVGILVTAYLMKYEQSHSTASNVYATRTGRRIVFAKGLASAAGTAFTAMLLVGTAVLLFLLYVPQLGTFLDSSVSSAMATEKRGLLVYPFITWMKMSQLTYLLCSSVCVIGYAVLSSLLCFVMSFFSKNAYGNAILTALLYLFWEAQWFGFPTSNLFSFVQTFNPAISMENVISWFMEYVLNPQTSYPGYETLVLFSYLLLSILISIPLWRHFQHKDII